MKFGDDTKGNGTIAFRVHPIYSRFNDKTQPPKGFEGLFKKFPSGKPPPYANMLINHHTLNQWEMNKHKMDPVDLLNKLKNESKYVSTNRSPNR